MADFNVTQPLNSKSLLIFLYPVLIFVSFSFAWILNQNPLLTFAIFLGLPLAIAALVSVRFGFYLLVVGSVLTRFVIPLSWGNLKVEQLIFLIVMLGLVVKYLPDRRVSLRSIKIDQVGILAILWVAINVISSFLNSPDKVASLKICLWLGFSVGIYLFTRNVIGRKIPLEKAVKVILVVGVLEAFYGLVVYLLFLLGKDVGGVQIDPVMFIPKVYGTIWEANIFGIFLVSIALIIFNLLLSGEYSKYKGWLLVGFFISVLGVVVSFTRSAWFALAMFLLISLVVSIKFFLKRPGLLLFTVILISIFAILLNTPFLEINATGGWGINFFTDYSTIAFRLIRVNLALDEWRSSPFLGWWNNSFGQRHYDPSRENAPDYLGVLFAQNLYDTGIIGLGLILALIVLQIKRWFKFLQLSSDSKSKTLMKSFLIAFMALIAMYQSTSAFWFGFNWIYLGVLSAIYERGLQKDVGDE